jgi:hypothetical protein
LRHAVWTICPPTLTCFEKRSEIPFVLPRFSESLQLLARPSNASVSQSASQEGPPSAPRLLGC